MVDGYYALTQVLPSSNTAYDTSKRYIKNICQRETRVHVHNGGGDASLHTYKKNLFR